MTTVLCLKSAEWTVTREMVRGGSHLRGSVKSHITEIWFCGGQLDGRNEPRECKTFTLKPLLFNSLPPTTTLQH